MAYKTTLFLTKDLSDDIFQIFAEQLSAARLEDNGPIKLVLSGNGGNSDASDALCDLIEFDGNIDGHLMGIAYSAHTHLFAVCKRRFVYPNSSLAIHEGRWNIFQDNAVDIHWLQQRIDRLRDLNKRQAERFAMVSNKNMDWWLEQASAARYGYTMITAFQMVEELNMARWAQSEEGDHVVT